MNVGQYLQKDEGSIISSSISFPGVWHGITSDGNITDRDYDIMGIYPVGSIDKVSASKSTGFICLAGFWGRRFEDNYIAFTLLYSINLTKLEKRTMLYY